MRRCESSDDCSRRATIFEGERVPFLRLEREVIDIPFALDPAIDARWERPRLGRFGRIVGRLGFGRERQVGDEAAEPDWTAEPANAAE